MNLFKRKFPLFLAVLFVLAAAGCGKENASSGGSESAGTEHRFRVKVMNAEKMLFRQRLKVHMNAQPVFHANLNAKIPGIIEVFDVGGGSKVKTGDVLFQTDKFQLEASLQIAEQDLKVAEASYKKSAIDVEVANERLKKAKIDLERNRYLYETSAISKDKFEQIELAYSGEACYELQAEAALGYAAAKVEQAKSNIAIAKRKYEDSIIKAPFDGTVVNTYYERYENAESGKKVLRLESSDLLTLSSLIGAELYEEVQVGKTMAEVSCPSTGFRALLPVTYKSPSIDAVNRTFEMKIDLPKNANVLSGMLCEVNVILRSSEGYGLPGTAFIAQSGGRYAIFADIDGKAKKFNVRPGIKDGDMTEILDAPADVAGLKFIVDGQSFVSDGSPLDIVK